MNKRIISLCLALALLLCLLPAAAPTAAAAGDVAINETNFPDANFRRYVSETFDQNGDGILSPDEIENAISIDCSWKGISSLKGIEYFTAINTLYCGHNQLTALDLSNNPQLIWLSCYGNQLTALDVSKNTELSLLYCYGNQLTVLDLSAVPKLLDALEKGMKSVRSKDNVVRYMVHNGEYDFMTGEELYDEIEMDLNQKTIPASNPFLDVTADDYFNDAVSWAYQNGVASGTSKTKFSPAKTCTREQVVTFLWRAYGCQEPETTVIPFVDVPADAYYAKAVLWAVEQGITTGKSKTRFGVGSPCTREQVVTFLWRAEGKPEPESTVNPFTDVSEESYAYKAILWAVEKGITKGTSKTKFSPAKTCTRGQVVTFLYRDVVGTE